MPDPKKPRVGDQVKFVTMPDEWQNPQYVVPPCSIEFMKTMIARRWPSRVREIDEFGAPWISARIRVNGRLEYHWWGIYEETGWRIVRPRS